MNRITPKDLIEAINMPTNGDTTRFLLYAQRLWELENKLEAGQLIESPCKIGDPIWVVYEHCDNGYLEYAIQQTVCVGFDIRKSEIRIITSFCCHDTDRHGNFTIEAQAESRLKELRGEK